MLIFSLTVYTGSAGSERGEEETREGENVAGGGPREGTQVGGEVVAVCEMSPSVLLWGFLLLPQQREHKKQMRKLLNPKVKSVKMKMK